MAFRIFSGWDRRQAEAAEVFAYSVRQSVSIEVDMRFLKPGEMPIVRFGVTEFSYSRFLVPHLCGFEGRALFVDGCDMLCLGDVAELEALDMGGRAVAVAKHPPSRLVPRQHLRPRSWTSMMLMDCQQLTMWTPTRVASDPDDVLMRLKPLNDDQIGSLPLAWNRLVEPGEEEPEADGAKLLHWSYLADPNGSSWIDRSGSAIWRQWRARWQKSLPLDAA